LVTHDRYDLPSQKLDSHFDAWEVFQGCREAAAESGANLKVVTHSIGESEFVAPEEWIAGGRLAAEKIAKENSATAAVCYDDYQALGLLQRLSELDPVCRRNVEVVATKSNPLCRLMEPSIISIDISPEEIGAAAAESILQLLNGKEASSLLLPGVLR
jgi:DNA-binding LacI/PurR family transcriptional regulator